MFICVSAFNTLREKKREKWFTYVVIKILKQPHMCLTIHLVQVMKDFTPCFFCTFNQPPSPDTSMPSWISVKLVSLPLSLHFKCLTQLLAQSAACNLVWGRKILTLFQRERDCDFTALEAISAWQRARPTLCGLGVHEHDSRASHRDLRLQAP